MEENVNLQTIESLSTANGSTLDVVKIWKTIQGEGPYAGTPCTFIRLAGCTLACEKCDTDYTTDRKTMSVGDILDELSQNTIPLNLQDLVVITGGEPFRQNIVPLIDKLSDQGYITQIETNGLHYRATSASCIVCSPKTPRIDERFVRSFTHFKYILEAGKVDPEDGLPTESLGYTGKPYRIPRDYNRCNIWVQPQDDKDPDKNQKNLEAAVASCLRFGYRLSLQLHKILGLE